VGRILATLDELKIRDNTLIVFTSDHGDLLGDHQYWFKGFYHFHQCTRTPLIFHWTGRVKAGQKVEGMAQAIDIFPTVMELAGLKNPPGVQGRSQAKVAAGGETGTGNSSALIEFLFRGVEAPARRTTGRRTSCARW